MEEMGLVLTLIVGLFILLGSIIIFVTKNNDNIVNFSISIAFSVISFLIILELIPEAWELIRENNSLEKSLFLIFLFTFLGIIILKGLDFLVPHHEHKDDKQNLLHIGLISSIALIMHNFIEGMAIYSSVNSSLELGILISIGVGLHNIPMGMVITSTIYKANNSIRKTIWLILLISISTFIGGLITFLNRNLLINNTILGIFLCLTLGMLMFLVLFELLPHIIHTKNKKETLIGIIIGMMVMFIRFIIS